MSNYEWQKYMKTKYLDLAHAMQKKGRPYIHEPDYFDNSVIVNDIKMANELIKACNEYIAEQLKMVERMVYSTTINRREQRETDKTANLKPCRCGTDSYPISPCDMFSDFPAWRIFCPTCGATTGLNTGYGAAVIEWNKMQSERKNENYDGVRDGSGD